MFCFFKSVALLIAVSLQVCGIDSESKENLSQSDNNIAANSKKRPLSTQQIKKQEKLKIAARGTGNIGNYFKTKRISIPTTHVGAEDSASIPTVSRNLAIIDSGSTTETCSRTAASQIEFRDEVWRRLESTKTGKVTLTETKRTPVFPEFEEAVAYTGEGENGIYWGIFSINPKIKHVVYRDFKDSKTAEEWVFELAKKLKLTLVVR